MNEVSYRETVAELNEVIQRLVLSTMALVKLDAEFDFAFVDEDKDPRQTEIASYEVSFGRFPGLCGFELSDAGKIREFRPSLDSPKEADVTATLWTEFVEPLQSILVRHVSADLFDVAPKHLSFQCTLHLPDVDHYFAHVCMARAVKDLRLDAFTETLLRPNANALMAELTPYLPWFDYAKQLAEQIRKDNHHTELIEDFSLLLWYLYQGGSFDYAKITRLCDFAGSLQPVRNLIMKQTPELVTQ
jgi:hypothetical protein